jgi:Lrp/AsnC family leucine-responsive transcriptional regulator
VGATENPALDRVDLRILGTLAAEGRMTWRELGEVVHLSPTAVAERVKRLERDGVILGYHADLDLAGLGYGIEAVIEVRRDVSMAATDFEDALRGRPELLDAVHLTGGWDYVVTARVGGTLELDRLVSELKSIEGAVETSTRVVLRRLAGFPRSPLAD